MSVARIADTIAFSSKSIDDALKQGIKRTSRSLRENTAAAASGRAVEPGGRKVRAYIVELNVLVVLDD